MVAVSPDPAAAAVAVSGVTMSLTAVARFAAEALAAAGCLGAMVTVGTSTCRTEKPPASVTATVTVAAAGAAALAPAARAATCAVPAMCARLALPRALGWAEALALALAGVLTWSRGAASWSRGAA